MEVSNGVNMNILNMLESIKEDIKICANNQECMIGKLQQIREKNQVKHQTSQFSCGDVNDLSGSLCLEGNAGSLVVKNNDSDVMLGDNNERYGRNSDGESDAYKVFDNMPSIKCIQQTGSVIEYYDVFTSYHNSYIFWIKEMGLGESCLVSLFMSGLKTEIKEPLRFYTLKTLSDAYVMAKLQEGTNEMLKNNLSKGVEKENNELAGYHGCCNENVNGEETEGMELEVPSKEEHTNEGGVKDEDLELNPLSEGDNNTCVVIGEKLVEFEDKDSGLVILNELVQKDGDIRKEYELSKFDCSNVLDELCDEKVEGIGMESKELVEWDDKKSFDSSKDADMGEAFSTDIKINSKSGLAFDSRCKESEVINESKIRDDTVVDVPSLSQPTDDVYKFLTPSWKEKLKGDFKKEYGSSFVDLIVTTSVKETVACAKMIQENKGDRIVGNQDKMHNSVVKVATKEEPTFDQLMFDTWKWLKRKRKCKKMRQDAVLLSSFPEPNSKENDLVVLMEDSEKFLNRLVQLYTCSFNGYGTGLQPGGLSFDESRIRGELVKSDVVVYASLNLPSGCTRFAHVRQVDSVSDGALGAHQFGSANRNVVGRVDFATGESGAGGGVGGSLRRGRNTHRVFNVVSWGVMMPIGAMARYLKVFKEASPAWFYIHVTCQVSAYIVGIVEWATGIKFGSDSTGIKYNTHRNMGVDLEENIHNARIAQGSQVETWAERSIPDGGLLAQFA